MHVLELFLLSLCNLVEFLSFYFLLYFFDLLVIFILKIRVFSYDKPFCGFKMTPGF